MYGIPKRKRQVSPEYAIKILEENHTYYLTREEVELLLDMIYDFANLAVSQQRSIQSERNSKLILRPGPGQNPQFKK